MGHIETASVEKKLANLGVTHVDDAGAVADIRARPQLAEALTGSRQLVDQRAATEDHLYRCRRHHVTRLPLFRSPHPNRRRVRGRRGREGASAGSFVRVRSRVTALGHRDSRPARPGICWPQSPASETDRSVDPARSQLSLQRSAAPAAAGLPGQPVQIFRRFDVKPQSVRERVHNLCGWTGVTALLES